MPSFNQPGDGIHVPKNLLTAAGDTIYARDEEDPRVLPIGTEGQVLTVDGDGLPAWDDIPEAAAATAATTSFDDTAVEGTALEGTTDVQEALEALAAVEVGGTAFKQATFQGTAIPPAGSSPTTANATVSSLVVRNVDGILDPDPDNTFEIDEDDFARINEAGLYAISVRFSFEATLTPDRMYTPTSGLVAQGIGQYVPSGVADRAHVFLPLEIVRVAAAGLALNGLNVHRSADNWADDYDVLVVVSKIG